MLERAIERLRDKRPLRRRQLTKRVALNMIPALITVALLLWAFSEQFFVLLPFVRAKGSTLPLYKAAPALCMLVMAVVFFVTWALVMAHFVRVVITDSDPATNPPFDGQLPQDCPTCRKCHGNKPDRCHHCSSCNACCLKMDHHCLYQADVVLASTVATFTLGELNRSVGWVLCWLLQLQVFCDVPPVDGADVHLRGAGGAASAANAV